MGIGHARPPAGLPGCLIAKVVAAAWATSHESRDQQFREAEAVLLTRGEEVRRGFRRRARRWAHGAEGAGAVVAGTRSPLH